MRTVLALPVAALLVAALPGAATAPESPSLDARIVAESTLVHDGERVSIHAHGGARPDEALLERAESALSRMERLLGRTLDVETLGPEVHLHVSPETTVSHVWAGYGHRDDPRPIVFLNPKIARLAVAGANATYAHELAHLLTWRFHSHTLREGLADWLALELHPDAAVGPNAAGAERPVAIPPAVRELLGTTQPPPDAVRDDAAFRRAYYAASRAFVAHLVALRGIETFLALYDAPDPEPLYLERYGASRAALVEAALATFAAPAD